MARDSVQLETAVNTISHEYLLEFTSEYGISKMLHPELPGPGDRIVDFPEGKVDECVFPSAVEWRTNASKDGMPTSGTYSVEAVRVLDTHRTPIQKQPEALLCLVGISRRYYLGDDVYPTFHYDDDREMDLFSLIRAPNPTKVKTGSRPRAPHELPLLTLTAPRVIEMDEPAAAPDSSGVPSAIEKSPLDFSDEAEASGQETAAPEVSPPEEVPVTTVLGGNQAAPVAVEPPVVQESRKRGHKGIDANAPPKSLRRDHADIRPSGSSRGGKSLAAMQLCLASNIFMYEGVPADVSDPDPLAFADAPSPHPADVVQDLESENVSSPTEVGSPGSRAAEEKSAGLSQELERMHAQFSELQVSNERLSQQVDALQQQVSGEETLKAAFEDYKRQQDQMVEQRYAEMDARLDAMSIDFDEELYPHMLTAIAGRRWVIGHGLRLATMKCAESLEMRQAFADVVSAGIAKGMSEGLKHGVDHGHAQRKIESLEAYDPEAEAKFAVALQSLKYLKLPLLDQLEGLRMLLWISSQLAIPVYPEVRDPWNPWACTEEIKLADAIAANISRAEQKKRSRIVCRTHGVDALQQQVSEEETLKAAFEDYKRQQDQMVEQRCTEMDALLDAMSIYFDEELYPHMLTAIAGCRWVIGYGLRLGGAWHPQQTIESLESYDPEAEAKFAAALQSLKDLKLPLLDQLEGLKDAPMDVIMASLYLEDDTGDDALQFICDLCPSSSQLAILVYPEVRDPRNPWAYTEEIKLADAIAANISRAEQKKRSRIVCRTHGVGSAHHARFDRISISEPIVVPQGLALILVDAATQTDPDA
uniref:Transposase (Putative), gypsy type n=1 Tax=Tanacetum cinerariifolium TaxID=118510 RepID=A0A6L2NXI2_TANCI|nr:transposase (putative), gypsy type [Tanacetum cinerariifolium]